jgi:hypothetical protein
VVSARPLTYVIFSRPGAVGLAVFDAARAA